MDLRTRGMALESQFEKELGTTKKLAELKREEAEELAAKVKELQGVVRRTFFCGVQCPMLVLLAAAREGRSGVCA